MKELVVNWHVTEACNFKCNYCFAKWDRNCKIDLFRNPELVRKLLDELCLLRNLFQGEFSYLRLNLVGGETFLYKKDILNVIQEAKERGVRLSVVTNGSKLDDELLQVIAKNVDTIGFSIDSVNEQTNLSIGRKEKDQAMNIDNLKVNISTLRSLNPDIKVKINTVVSKLDYKEFMGDFIDHIKPNKWKVFQMLPMSKKSQFLKVTEFEFKNFIENHKKYKKIIYAENNEKMKGSYLMVDPSGRFFQNGEIDQGYVYSNPIHDVGYKQAFSEIPFGKEKFLSRYTQDKANLKNKTS